MRSWTVHKYGESPFYVSKLSSLEFFSWTKILLQKNFETCLFKTDSSTKIPKEVTYLQKSIKVFGYFEDSILIDLMKDLETKTLRKDEFLFKPGDSDQMMYIIFEGKIQLKIDGFPVDTRKQGESILSLLSIFSFNKKLITILIMKSDNIFSIIQ